MLLLAIHQRVRGSIPCRGSLRAFLRKMNRKERRLAAKRERQLAKIRKKYESNQG